MDAGSEIANLIFYLCYSATICMEIFLPCYFGTELMLKNNNLTTAAYSSDWTRFPIYTQKMLVVFMEISKKPRILLSGKLFSLSLNSFLVVRYTLALFKNKFTTIVLTGVKSNVQFVCSFEEYSQVKFCYHNYSVV